VKFECGQKSAKYVKIGKIIKKLNQVRVNNIFLAIKEKKLKKS